MTCERAATVSPAISAYSDGDDGGGAHARTDGDARSLTRRAARSDIQYGPRARSRKKTKPKSAAVGPMWRLIWAITFNDNYFYILIAARSPCLVLFAHEGGKRT
jgi:hypothetical protein